jgi:hypothetical protein
MKGLDAALTTLVQAIVADDEAAVSELLAAKPTLASASFTRGATRETAKAHYIGEIGRYVFAGDTALHIAAAAYELASVRKLIAAGADVRARNRRGAEPLHGAAVGLPGGPTWNPRAQSATIACLIKAGADADASDRDGATPLHRAVRTRCAAAVKALLDNGADPRKKTKRGSTPLRLATQTAGRGGTGSPQAKAQQKKILRLLAVHRSS